MSEPKKDPAPKSWSKIAEETDAIRKERFEAKGYKDLFVPQIGENPMTIKPDAPMLVQTENGERIRLEVIVDGEALQWLVNPNGSVLNEPIKHFMEHPDEPFIAVLVRTGEGRATKYDWKL